MTHKTQQLINDLDYEFEMSNAKEKDPLLQEEDIETFFLIPNQRVNLPRAVCVWLASLVPSKCLVPLLSSSALRTSRAAAILRLVSRPIRVGRHCCLLHRLRDSPASSAAVNCDIRYAAGRAFLPLRKFRGSNLLSKYFTSQSIFALKAIIVFR